MEKRDDDEPCCVCETMTGNPEDDDGEFLCSLACATTRAGEKVEQEREMRAAYAEYRAIWPEGMQVDGPRTIAEVCAAAYRIKRGT